MPTKSSLLDRAVSSLANVPYICRSCRSKQALAQQWPRNPSYRTVGTRGPTSPRGAFYRTSRRASTISAATVVNAKPDIPPASRRLHEALTVLEHEAGIYTNISQLRLALRGLESENPVTRVAILGVEDQAGARRLARALLTDPLAKESPWEKTLAHIDEKEGRALLLRYGEQPNTDDRHPLIRTLFIPSSKLYNHRLEFFVQATAASRADLADEASSLLVPGLETASSPGGRLSTVTYPVHKSLVYANGLGSLAYFAPIANDDADGKQTHMVKGVVDGSWTKLERGMGQPTSISPINLNLAELAIETLRKSVQRSTEYEHAWFDSGLPTITTWLSERTIAGPESVKQSLCRLISVIITGASNAINRDEATKSQDAQTATVPASTREIIDQGITIWAENAHTELRDRLSAAFVSKSWRRIKWYKLFWRVDDVRYIMSDVLQRAWLIDAEKEMIWMNGRIHQSGLLGAPKLRPPPFRDPDDEDKAQKLGGQPRQLTVNDVIARYVAPFDTDNGDVPLSLQAYPQHIAMARRQLCQITTPTLQSLAQNLVLQSISTTILSTSVSALLYVSISATSVYEAGVIAALGTVYSLRRLQTKWEQAKQEWKATIIEEGRRVLQLSEEQCRQVVKEGGYGKLDEAGIEERRIAREAVDRVHEALEEVEDSEMSR
ncbi:MAG: hypothetical protein Q9163_004411 [Psora crenata]